MHHFKKFANRVLRIMLVFGFALSTMSFPSSRVVALDPLPPGTVTVDKTAASLGGGFYEITLTITGVPVVKASDIVLVMDTSGSMSSAKMNAMKSAAKNFVDTIIARNEGHRIAIIRFSTDPSLVLNFSQNASTLKSAIDGLSATGYTHLEGGVYQARLLLDSASSIASNSNAIVVLGDGFPTRGYDFDAQYVGPLNYEIRPNGNCRVTVSNTNRDNPLNYTGRYNFDYSQSIYTVDTDSIWVEKSFTVGGTCSNGDYDDYDFDAEFSLADSVLWQGQQAQAAGATIYSIGLNVDATGQQILSSIANGGYYNGNTGNLNAIYDQIASQIIHAGTNAVMNDKMGSAFTFQNISAGYELLDINYDPATEVMTWNVGTIGSEPMVVKYVIKIDDGLPTGYYPTNEYAELSYTNISGDPHGEVFPKPIIEHIVIDDNDAPVAVDDEYVVDEDGTLVVVNPNGVLSNDTDADGDSLTAVLVNDVDHGTLTLNTNGTFTYVPDANFNGTDSFTYKANDSQEDSNVVTVTITVNPENDAPVANDDEYSTDEETLLTIPATGVLGNDSDLDGNTLTAVLVVDVAHGVLTLNPDGSFTYLPELDFVGTDSFTYKANDGTLDSNTAKVMITVGAANDAPVAVADDYEVNEDNTLVVIDPNGVLANDSDVDGDVLTAILVDDVDHGTLTLNADGTFTYVPNANYNGTDTFTYQANDSTANSNVVTVTIAIKPINDAPVAVDNEYDTDEDVTLNVIAPNGVLANDSDVDGDVLTAVLVDDFDHGTLTLNADGTLTYVPNANYHGNDSFTYKAYDGTVESNLVTVTITVHPVNDAPIANVDEYEVDEDSSLVVIDPNGVLENDTDAEGDSLTAVLVDDVAHGTLTLNADGTFTYAPDADFHGTDTFTYKANDGSLDSIATTVTIIVRPINDPPVAITDTYETDEDVTLNIPAPGLLGNDYDIDSPSISVYGYAWNSFQGTPNINPDGSFSFVPYPNFVGTASITYYITDGNGGTASVAISIIVKPINDAPVANNDEYSTDEDELLTVPALGVLGNDTDIEGNPLTAIVVVGPLHGELFLNADGSFTYLPDANFQGSDSFTYKANDGSLDSNVATVTINVGAVNDAPVAVEDDYDVDEDGSLVVIDPNGVLSNDSDPDGDSLTAVLVLDVEHGTLTLNPDGTFTYTPDANFHGTDSFTYQANDGDSDSNVVKVTITVNPVNDAPVAVEDMYSVDEDETLTVVDPDGVLANDTDLDGDALNAVLVMDVQHGTLTLNPDGTFTYVPAADFNGTDSFTYKANDGDVDSNVVTVTITVDAVNDGPTATDDAYDINEDGALIVVDPNGILANDSDIDGDMLTAILITDVQHGTLTLNADGTFTYIPEANFYGTDSFTYKANDGTIDSTIATVTITVNPVNDPPVANNDYYVTDEDTPITIPAPGFYANDVDPDNAIYHNMYNSGNQFGTLVAPFGGGGTFTYYPTANFNGVASFFYQISDGQYSSMAYIYITVNPVNDGPAAQDDEYTIDEDTVLSVPAAGVMENDSDVDGPSLNVSLLSDVSNGTLVLNPDGSFEYTPDANFNGVDSFIYTLTDGTLTTNATVTITVNPINDAPVAEDDAYSTNEDVQLVIAAPGILGNDVDVDSIFSIEDHGQPANGTVVVQPDGSFVYTPNANFNGVDSFVYGITDGEHTDFATVTITVNPINDVPSADNKTLTVAEGGAGSGLFTGLDADGDVLTFKILTQPVNGTVSFNATTGAFTYTHNGGETTSDSFTYAVNDGKVDSAAATVSITVTPVNDAPTAAGATYTVQIGSVFSRNIVRGDADGDPLTISIVNGPDRGAVSIAGGLFTYTHDGVTLDSDTFTFRVYDGQAYSPIRTIRINFTELPFENTAPEVTNAEFETEFETPLDETLGDLGNDFDDDDLTFTLVTQPAHGTVTLNADGTFRYVPDNDYEGDDSFTYKANDGTDDSNIATVTIKVGEEIIVDPEPTPEATLPWWWLLGLLPFLLFLIRRPRPEVQDVALNPDGTITTTWGYLGPRLMHKDYDRDESILEVVSGEVKVLPPVDKVPYEFDRGRHENIFKTVSDKNAVIRWTIKKKAEELDKELIEKMLKKNQK